MRLWFYVYIIHKRRWLSGQFSKYTHCRYSRELHGRTHTHTHTHTQHQHFWNLHNTTYSATQFFPSRSYCLIWRDLTLHGLWKLSSHLSPWKKCSVSIKPLFEISIVVSIALPFSHPPSPPPPLFPSLPLSPLPSSQGYQGTSESPPSVLRQTRGPEASLVRWRKAPRWRGLTHAPADWCGGWLGKCVSWLFRLS